MEEEKDIMLTTFDNPFNPFTEFISWFKQDHLLGHQCCEKLAIESNTNNIASEEINDKYIVEAMKRIVKEEPMIYRIVTIDDYYSDIEGGTG